MDESIDNVMGDELDEDEEAEEIVNKVLDEIGVDLNAQLQNTPQNVVASSNLSESGHRVAEPVGAGAEGQSANLDDDLQARLNSLKR